MSGIIGTSHSKSKIIGRSQDTAKAWVNFNGYTFGERDSFNVSSLGDEANEIHKINFITAMPNTNYCYVAVSEGENSIHIRFCQTSTVATTYLSIRGKRTNGSVTLMDQGNDHNNVIIFGD
jgi:hypothetical protein